MQHLAPPSATYAEQQAYRLGIPGFPGHVDRWLIANSRSPQINHLSDYLMLRDPSSEYVTCFVERRCNNKIYILYLVAIVSSRAKTNLFFRKSPRVIIDRFIGCNQEVLAPLWTKWDKECIKFQQPTATFTKLFMQMASWGFNKDQPGLAVRMVEWSRSVAMSTHVLSNEFIPIVTPDKRSPLQTLRNRCGSSTASSNIDSSPSERAQKRCRKQFHDSITNVSGE